MNTQRYLKVNSIPQEKVMHPFRMYYYEKLKDKEEEKERLAAEMGTSRKYFERLLLMHRLPRKDLYNRIVKAFHGRVKESLIYDFFYKD